MFYIVFLTQGLVITAMLNVIAFKNRTKQPMTQTIPQTPGGLIWWRFQQHRLAFVSLLFLSFLVLLCFSAPLIESALGLSVRDIQLTNKYAPSSADHWLGTDELGRDVFIRLLYGGRVSLGVGFLGVFLATFIGIIIGVCAGYLPRLDAWLMRFTDMVIAMPLLPLLIVLAAVDLTKFGIPESLANDGGASFYRMVFIIAIVNWTTTARLVRSVTLSLRQREFIKSAMALGSRRSEIIMKHILPNVISPIIVAMTLSIGQVIILESTLSFLGFGVQPPMPSWGNMLTNAQTLIWESPKLAILPGIMIFLTVIAFNFLGDGLQDAVDPKATRR